MPRPNPGESEKDYVGRFMASPEAQKDFPDEKQRAAVAYSMWGEKKNGVCQDCGGETVDGKCIECGYQPRGVAETPPIEKLRNLCPFCRHQLEPEHDSLGCHVEGCSCTEKIELIVSPEDVLPNAGDINDLDPAMGRMWDEASDAEKRRCAGMADLGIGIIQFRWSQMPDSAKAALKKKVFDVENKNAESAALPCAACGHPTGKHGVQGCDMCVGDRCMHVQYGRENADGQANENTWKCLECGRKFKDAAAAERATLSDRGCPGCGGTDIDDVPENANTDTCKTCAAGAFFRSYQEHAKSCAQCGSASSEGALCAEGRKLYDAMEHDHLTHEARNRKETVAEAFTRLKLEAEKWWDEKGQPDRELALKRAGLPADTEAVKLGWAALPAATRKAVVDAMNDGYRHEVNNAGQLPAGWEVQPAADFKDADGKRPKWATKNFYVLDSATNPVGEGNTRAEAIADALAHRPVSNADPRADQAAMVATRLKNIIAAHGSAMIYKRGSSAPLTVKSEAEAGDLGQIEGVYVPQGVSNGTGQGPRHKDLFKEWYELDKKQDELTRQLHEVESDTGAVGRYEDPKRAPLIAEIKRVEQALGAIMAKDAEERRNARGSELAKKLGVAHPKDLPFDQPNDHGCNGCDAVRVPLNADGYCKQCASEQGAFINADVQARGGEEAGKRGGTVTVVNDDEIGRHASDTSVAKNSNYPASYFKRPESKERADSQGIEDMEDEDLTPAGLKAKREALAEIGGLDNAVSGIQHVGADQRQAEGEAVYGSRR